MGRKVANNYYEGSEPRYSVVHVLSYGYYDICIQVDTKMVEYMRPHSWCLDQGKGQVYTMDLTMELPTKLGFKTPRVYLRDFVLYKNDLFGKVLWRRDDLCDYRLAECDTTPCVTRPPTK